MFKNVERFPFLQRTKLFEGKYWVFEDIRFIKMIWFFMFDHIFGCWDSLLHIIPLFHFNWIPFNLGSSSRKFVTWATTSNLVTTLKFSTFGQGRSTGMARLTKKSADCCIHIKKQGQTSIAFRWGVSYYKYGTRHLSSLSLSRMHLVTITSTFLHPDILR